MTAFAIDVTCPQCAGPVHHVNETTNGLLAATVVACPPCKREWELTVRLAQHSVPRQVRIEDARMADTG